MANSAVFQIIETLPFHLVALLSFLTFLILPYKWLYPTKSSLPSPRKLPIIGNLHQLGTLPHRSLLSLSKQYGDRMLLHLGSKPTLVVSSPDAAEEIMKTHDIVFANRPYKRVACIILYNGRDITFANYGGYWRQLKSISVLHMLSNKKIQSFRKVREEEVGLMIERIKKATPSEPVNLSSSIVGFMSNVVCRAAFGNKYVCEEGYGNIKDLMNDISESLGAFTVGDLIPWLSWIDEISGVLRKARKVAKAFDALLEKIVQEHIDRTNVQNQKDGKADRGGEKVQDLVDVLLEIQRNDSSFERESIKAFLLDMLAAGTETTSTLLEWTMSELLIHPKAMKQLEEEVRGIMVKGKTIIDEDDLKKMKYLKAVIKESLRLHPPVSLLVFREASQDAKIQNSQIMAGTQVIINAWAIQRDPAYWEEPDKFSPERFLNSSVDFKGKDFEYIPFGAGRRGCPGTSFGVAKAELTLANLVGHFNWKLPGDVEPDAFMAEAFGISVHKRDPLLVIPTPYSLN